MFGSLYSDRGSIDALIEVAVEFSPRCEITGPCDVTLDLSGLARLFGTARAIADELQRTAASRDLRVRIAIAGTATAARLLARGSHHAITVIEPGGEPEALASLPLALLATVTNEHANNQNVPNVPNVPNDPNDSDALAAFRRWGLRTLGDIAQLPSGAVAARLGQAGVRWQRLARGEDPRPLLPAVQEERFEQALDLEWPIEGLEPLSFVLGRLIEPLAAHLDRRGRGAAVLHVRLHLVTRAVHERALQLPAPMKDARTLRTLALLDLESHPPPAAIDRVVVAVDPTPARVLQFSLLTRPLPSPEQISTLMARLSALMGEGRCGSPAAVETWQPGAFAMKPFAPESTETTPPSFDGCSGRLEQRRKARHRGTEVIEGKPNHSLGVSVSQWPVGVNGVTQATVVALRRFRIPVPVRVRVEQGRPVRVLIDRRGFGGGSVTRCAGPWRTAGNWWTDGAWERDEWDVTLSDGATYRVFRDRGTDAWFLEGVVD